MDTIHSHIGGSCYGAVLMCKQEGFQSNYFLPKTSYLSGESIVFLRVIFDFGLKILQPLLFPLPALEGGNTIEHY